MPTEQNEQSKTNREQWLQEEEKLADMERQAVSPGGDKAVARLASQGKRPVRELIHALIDPDSTFFELGVIAGFDLEYPGGIRDVPCAGLVCGVGKIHGSPHAANASAHNHHRPAHSTLNHNSPPT